MRNISHPSERARVILLGASNLTHGLSIITETARLHLNAPIDIVAAAGHGRSFGNPSRVIARTLPGILQSGLWHALDNSIKDPPPSRTVALITDIGNDIVYGRSADELLEWITAAVQRLHAHNAEIIITTLPLAAIQRMPRWQAKIIKTIIYPGMGPNVDIARARAADVDQRVRQLAVDQDLHLVELKPHWYGFDPIHIQRRHWPRAAADMFAPLRPPSTDNSLIDRPAARGSLARWIRLRSARPQQLRLAGISLHRAQPARRLPDGSTFSHF